jgi:uridine phosphorylase
MGYPMLEGKYAHESVVPRLPGRFPLGAPAAAILCYPRWLLREIAAGATEVDGWAYRGDVYLLDDGVAVVGGLGVGGPSAAMAVEELGAAGVRRFVIVGMAGGLQADLEPAGFVVCDSALRDEGVSHHYLPWGRWVRPAEKLTASLVSELRSAGSADEPVRVGPTWTTDAPYRETAEEVRAFRAEGVVTVEMEAASVFAVAEVRGYQAAAAFVVSDLLTETGWTGHFRAPGLRPNLRRLLSATRRALAAPDSAPSPSPSGG